LFFSATSGARTEGETHWATCARCRLTNRLEQALRHDYWLSRSAARLTAGAARETIVPEWDEDAEFHGVWVVEQV
jgi:hypothetical protein